MKVVLLPVVEVAAAVVMVIVVGGAGDDGSDGNCRFPAHLGRCSSSDFVAQLVLITIASFLCIVRTRLKKQGFK